MDVEFHQLEKKYAGLRMADTHRRAIVERPLLYLQLDAQQEEAGAPADPGAQREQRLLCDLGLLAAICRRGREALRERELAAPK